MKKFFENIPLLRGSQQKMIKPLVRNDYEIDILIAKLAAILIIVFGFYIVRRSFIGQRPFFWSVFLIVMFILIPGLYLFFLKTYNFKLTKLSFQIWFLCILILCFSMTNDALSRFYIFWRVILPAAFVTVCMLIGVIGVKRIKDPDELNHYIKEIEISKSHYNLLILIYSITYIIGLLSTFIFMVLAGKYFHDFAFTNWPSLEDRKVLLFYVGMTIGFYPSRYLGGMVCTILTTLVNLIYKYYVGNHNENKA